MRNKLLGGVVFWALVSTLGCRVPTADWNGTWKVNPAKSSYQGQILTISISVDGDYRFDEGSSHTLRCDGQDRPIGNNRTLACEKGGITVLDIDVRENGVKKRTTHDELSADGKAFTTTVTEFRPNGPVVTSQIAFSRLSGSSDFAGEWLDTSYLKQHADMTLRLDNQTLHIDYPSVGQQIDAPLNGVESPVRGPHVQEGATLAVLPAGNREFRMVTKLHGKIFTQGSLKLSKDGRTITSLSWTPDRPDVEGVLLYEKKVVAQQ
jgi:hypothetical protein